MIQRYDITAEPGNSLVAHLEVDRQYDGDWVKWIDVLLLLKSVSSDMECIAQDVYNTWEKIIDKIEKEENS